MNLSIITINYNNKNGLDKTLKSIQAQGFKDYESIVIDGGSSDGSVEVLKQYESIITYWHSEKDAGIYDAMNKGILKAKGDYILFLNSGDYLYEENSLFEFFKYKFSEAVVYGNMIIRKASGEMLEGFSPSSVTFQHLHLDTIWHPVSLYRRDLFSRFGLYNLEFRIVADYEFLLRIYFSKSVSWRYIPVFLSVFTLDGVSSLPDNLEKLKLERKRAQLKNYPISFLIKIYWNILKERLSR